MIIEVILMLGVSAVSYKFYEYSGCGTCKKAIKFLDQHNINYKKIPIRDTPPSKAELKKMLKAMNGEIKKLFNTSGMDYRKLNIKDKLPAMTESQAIELLHSNGNLIKRPFILGPSLTTVGFKEELWKEIS
jgi:arsenate reductase (glutaredoxin)